MFPNRSIEDMSSSMDIVEAETGTEVNDKREEFNVRNTSRSPSKARSLSDGGQPILSPSPKFREPEKPVSKDDSSISESPTTPRRPAAFARGLSLQMPPKDFMPVGSSAYINRVPLSPKLDQSQTYGSPTSVLPRRSRGLDFSRAATNLHHSTLAEQSSPDSSPTITGRAMNIPNRKNGLNFTSAGESSLWSPAPNTERMMVSNSLGSVNMLASDDSESSSDNDDLMESDDIDDSIITTPQVSRMTAPFGGSYNPSPGSAWSGQSPAVNSLMNFQSARLRSGKSRKGSRSGPMASPTSKSPPTMRNIESNYFNRQRPVDSFQSRRESISWAANQLHISGSESDDAGLKSTLENVDGMPSTPGKDGQRGVIRRVVTRRGNMLPKTKGFARIRAALAEESAPVETEVRREAEVVRQTRESDMDLEPSRHPSISTIDARSSPIIGPTQDSLEGIPEDDIMADASSSQLSGSFKQQVIRNSKGKEFWDSFSDDNNRTPPPPNFNHRGSTSGMSEDLSLEAHLSTPLHPHRSNSDSSPSRSSTPQASEPMRKITHKRRRDDDLDPTSFKRRAVSPGMSVHNSPVMQSPMQRDLAPWGSRPNSNGEPGNGKSGLGNGSAGIGGRRIGFQGMVDTNDGLMKMSIE
ncbi:hypothetical protein ACHAPC_004739 [Botrytis cinerea]|uniref:Uncharacterized protein n=2 Tax=Botryotinia fuckeliana TaxID=40559 RepID=G2YRZ2_BOTF4|nr:hypothetical protein BcDW1_3115 [Botrytis cinerea BcDW1]CCD54390.1 hypothetical protein BofuT4_P124380.1 [Botrytis cinerea T4]